jgi:hypothetical protein
MSSIKPCPFCGYPAEIDTQQPYRNFQSGVLGSAVAVYCTGCIANMSICREDVPDVDADMVIKLWNARNKGSIS